MNKRGGVGTWECEAAQHSLLTHSLLTLFPSFPLF